MKKLFALLLALAMTLSLAACGGETSTEDTSTDDQTTEDTTGETTGFAVSSDYGDFTVVDEGKLHMSTNAARQTRRLSRVPASG